MDRSHRNPALNTTITMLNRYAASRDLQFIAWLAPSMTKISHPVFQCLTSATVRKKKTIFTRNGRMKNEEIEWKTKLKILCLIKVWILIENTGFWFHWLRAVLNVNVSVLVEHHCFFRNFDTYATRRSVTADGHLACLLHNVGRQFCHARYTCFP